MLIKFTLNGRPLEADLAPGLTLLEYLRNRRLYSLKYGCDQGECGACAVLVDGRSQNACLLLMPMVAGKKVETVEGLTASGEALKTQESFIGAGAIQCGYCTPGMIISLVALQREKQTASEVEIRTALAGNLCRCTGYVKPVDAARQLMGEP